MHLLSSSLAQPDADYRGDRDTSRTATAEDIRCLSSLDLSDAYHRTLCRRDPTVDSIKSFIYILIGGGMHISKADDSVNLRFCIDLG